MTKEFLITIKRHKKLGNLFIPFMATKEEFFYTHLERIPPYCGKNYLDILQPVELDIIDISDEYADKDIFNRFGRKNETMVQFFNRLEKKFAEEHIRPMIDNRMNKIFMHIRDHNLPVYLYNKEGSIYHSKAIYVASNPAEILFKFERVTDGIHYAQHLHHEDKSINLKTAKAEIVVDQPCRIVIGKNLYWFKENVDGKKLKPFFYQDKIFIPAKLEKKYFRSFICSAVKNFHVDAKGFEIEELQTKPVARLYFERSWYKHPTLKLFFFYGENRIYPAASHQVITTLKEKKGFFIIQKTHRDYKAEQSIIKNLIDIGLTGDKEYNFFPVFNEGVSDECKIREMITWINRNYKVLKSLHIGIDQSFFQNQYYFGEIAISFDISKQIDWFDIKAVINIKNFSIPFIQFRKNIVQQIPEFTLPDGTIFIIPDEWFSRYSDIMLFGKESNGGIQLKKHHAALLHDEQQIPKTIKAQIEAIINTTRQHFSLPQILKATLRNYQNTGYQWLMHLYYQNINGCLADDMGLGKTIQTIALLANKDITPDQTNIKQKLPATTPSKQLTLFDIDYIEQEPRKTANTSLIVMPASLTHNWRNELQRFAPDLSVVEYSGIHRRKLLPTLTTYNIVLSSYGIVRNDIEILSQIHFNYLILDESQLVKNPTSKTYRALLTLQSRRRLILSGTPVENSLIDLWAQFNFLNRDMLGSLPFFKKQFIKPIERENVVITKKLQLLIQPFMLRRTKEEVATELPPVTKQIIYSEMTEDQKKWYEAEKSKVRNSILENIKTKGLEKSSIFILSGLNRLRQIACHPLMIDQQSTLDSGKFEDITRSISNVLQGQHNILIFSSFVKHLRIIESWLNLNRIKYALLTGETRDREQSIAEFTADHKTRVFLISLKAGGVGLNLTKADYVFIIDPWWNPAAEKQAIDRAYRIGQDKNVFIYHFVTKESIEEKMLNIQKEKKILTDTFINQNNILSYIDPDDIDKLL